MPGTSVILFPVLRWVCTYSTLRTVETLPEKVAIHFDVNGGPMVWATANVFRMLITTPLLGLALLLVWLFAGQPRLTNGRGQIPDCEYWFSEGQRHATQAFC